MVGVVSARRWSWRRGQDEAPQPGAELALRPVVAGTVVPRSGPALSPARWAELHEALGPHLDPASADLVAAVVMGAALVARQRQQGSSAAFLEAARRGVWSGPVPGPPEFREHPQGSAS